MFTAAGCKWYDMFLFSFLICQEFRTSISCLHKQITCTHFMSKWDMCCLLDRRGFCLNWVEWDTLNLTNICPTNNLSGCLGRRSLCTINANCSDELNHPLGVAPFVVRKAPCDRMEFCTRSSRDRTSGHSRMAKQQSSHTPIVTSIRISIEGRIQT